MLHNYSNFEGLQAFSRAFRSATYNSSGASMYSVLDSSKKYASVGKKMIGFSRPDSVALKERSDAETYGVGLTDFYQKVAKEQVDAPDAIKQPKYAGRADEPVAGAEAAEGAEGAAEEAAEGGEMPTEEVEVEAIDIGDYEALPEDQAKSMKNRVAALKSIPEFEKMQVKLVKSKTKSSVAIYVPDTATKKALITHYEILVKEMPEGNSKRLIQYLAGGAPFKIKPGAPAPTFTPRKKDTAPRRVKVKKEKAVGGAGPPAPAATSATSAVTKVLESEGKFETPAKSK